jgi:hypothetical protein
MSEAVEIKKKFQNVLPQLGLKFDNNVLSYDKFDNLFPAWKWMAAIENATVIYVGLCKTK